MLHTPPQIITSLLARYERLLGRVQPPSTLFGRLVWGLEFRLYTLLLHLVCVPHYFGAHEQGFVRVQQWTCGHVVKNYEAFQKKRRNFWLGAATLSATVGMAALLPGGQDASSVFDPTFRLTVSEYHDGHDWELRIRGAGKEYASVNDIHDRHLSHKGAVAVWQEETEQGSEIMYWSVLEEEPIQLTHNTLEDIRPKTDGHKIIWQQKRGNEWRIAMIDVNFLQMEPITLSVVGSASDIQIKDGVVAWQEWIDGNWEIMMFHPELGLTRVTNNQTPDLTPVLVGNLLTWEGIDPNGGDKEIMSYHLNTQAYGFITYNDVDDDSPYVASERLHFFERGARSVEVTYDHISGRMTRQELPPLPVITPEEPELSEPETPTQESILMAGIAPGTCEFVNVCETKEVCAVPEIAEVEDHIDENERKEETEEQLDEEETQDRAKNEIGEESEAEQEPEEIDSSGSEADLDAVVQQDETEDVPQKDDSSKNHGGSQDSLEESVEVVPASEKTSKKPRTIIGGLLERIFGHHDESTIVQSDSENEKTPEQDETEDEKEGNADQDERDLEEDALEADDLDSVTEENEHADLTLEEMGSSKTKPVRKGIVGRVVDFVWGVVEKRKEQESTETDGLMCERREVCEVQEICVPPLEEDALESEEAEEEVEEETSDDGTESSAEETLEEGSESETDEPSPDEASEEFEGVEEENTSSEEKNDSEETHSEEGVDETMEEDAGASFDEEVTSEAQEDTSEEQDTLDTDEEIESDPEPNSDPASEEDAPLETTDTTPQEDLSTDSPDSEVQSETETSTE